MPQEWLWCETWCDDESKQRAKTIDLCNNPKTKEPKLTSARRIVAEWEDYDRELRDFLEQLQHQSDIHKNNSEKKSKGTSTIDLKKSDVATHKEHQEL